eukprot:GCRY01004019.1.p1 GENE.GCRY01004019.1~~GCRY01004019.1.p1  ORF type:complete len:115 (-),score=20.57 GCRY01004019.1:57-401(-)
MQAGSLIAVIGDKDTVTGFLLAGVGNVTKNHKNFLVIDNKTTVVDIEKAFKSFTTNPEIGILLITQQAAENIRPVLDSFAAPTPAVLEIPSKDAPYDPSKDFIMSRINKMLGLQ